MGSKKKKSSPKESVRTVFPQIAGSSGGSSIASSAGKLNVKAELVAAQIKKDRERKRQFQAKFQDK